MKNKLKIFCSIVIISITLFCKESASAQVKSLFVNKFSDIIGNGPSETCLLNFAQQNGFNDLILYELYPIMVTQGNSAAVASFIEDAKAIGLKVTASGESLSFITYIKNYNNGHPLNQRFDAFCLEYEFWIQSSIGTGTDDYCDYYLMPNGYPCNFQGAYDYLTDANNRLLSMKTQANLGGMAFEIYLGQFNIANPQFVTIAQTVDTLLLTSYVNPGNVANVYTSSQFHTRVQAIADAITLGTISTSGRYITIRPIFSSEGPSCPEVFLGSYLPTHLYSDPYTIYYLPDFNGDLTTNIALNRGNGKLVVDGYNWFKYSEMPAQVFYNGNIVSTGFTVCSGETFTSGPGCTYLWQDNTTSNTITLINTTTAPIIIPLQVTVTNPVITPGACLHQSWSSPVFNITVNPTPTVNSPSNQTVCNGENTAAIIFSGTVAGTTYSWTNSNTTIGLTSPGNGNIPSFQAENTGNNPVTATITVTPSANGCDGQQQIFTITVNPTPTVAPVSNQTVCNQENTAAIIFSGTVAGTTYSWTNSNTTIGLTSPGSGDISSFQAENTGNNPVTATITVTPHYTNNSVTCDGSPQSFTITVNPTPTVDPLSNQTVCNGENTAPVNFSGTVAGTTYLWTNSNTTIGLTSPGSGNIPSFQAVNTGTNPVTATITVTPTANGCNGQPQSFTITVNASPIATATSWTTTICFGGTVNVTASLGASYIWYESLTPIPGATNAVYPATAAGSYTVEVTSVFGCTAVSAPPIVLTEDPTCCGNPYPELTQNDIDVAVVPITGTYVLNSDIVINAPITFSTCTLYIANARSITVNSALLIEVNSWLEACNEMWEGIIVNSSGNLTINSSHIEDAIAAVAADGGGMITIADAEFDQDLVSVSLKNANFNSNCFITGTTFDCSQALQPPNPGLFTYAHILLENASAIIGNGTSAALLNSFRNGNYGIHGNESNLEAYNNSFYTLGTTPVLYDEGGICMTNSANPNTVFIGSMAANQFNTFEDCQNGIHLNGRFNANIVGNLITAPTPTLTTYYGIFMFGNTDQNFRISSNVIYDAKYGIEVSGIYNNTIAVIEKNEIYGGFDPGGIPKDIIGIGVWGGTNVMVPVQITGNTVDDMRQGIVLMSVDGTYDWNLFPLINDNHIHFNFNELQLGMYSYLGIWFANCHNAKVEKNDITWSGITVPAVDPYDYNKDVTGIEMDYDKSSLVLKNQIKNCGTGIIVYNDCKGSYINCNGFTDCYPAVELANAHIPSQNSLCHQNYNSFKGTLYGGNHYKIEGTWQIAQPVWFWLSAPYDPHPYAVGSIVDFHDFCISEHSPCDDGKGHGGRDELMSKSNVNAVVYPNPTSGELFFEIFTDEADAKVLIIANALGQEMIEKKLNADENRFFIDCSAYQAGIYFYRIYDSKSTLITKGSFSLIR